MEQEESYRIEIGFTDKEIPWRVYWVKDQREAKGMLNYWQREVSCPAFLVSKRPKSKALRKILA